jgi:iron transport multicopper oxidase
MHYIALCSLFTSLVAHPGVNSSVFPRDLDSGQRVVLDWTVGWISNVNPDGGCSRRAIGVNGQWPPPAVHASLGDTLVVTLHNQLPTGTSLHFHGVFQTGSNNMDGAAFITQCLIGPGHSYTYHFKVLQVPYC